MKVRYVAMSAKNQGNVSEGTRSKIEGGVLLSRTAESLNFYPTYKATS